MGIANVNGQAEIVTGAGAGGEPLVNIYSASGTLLKSFDAFNPTFRGGVSVAIANVNGQAEIVTGAGAGGEPLVNVYSSNGTLLNSFDAFDPFFAGGVGVAIESPTPVPLPGMAVLTALCAIALIFIGRRPRREPLTTH